VSDDLSLDDATIARQLAKPHGAPAQSAPTIARVGYCGASDIAAIIGVDPFRTPLDVWASATGRAAPLPSMAMEAGNDHEAAVIAGYRRRVTRHGLVEHVEHPGPGTLLSPRDSRRGATPDAIARHARYGPIVVEAKYVGSGGAHAWGPEDAGADGLPEHVLCQVHWQTLTVREVYGWAAPVAHVAADIGTDRRVYEVEIDEALLEALLEAFGPWWAAHVDVDEAPMPTERDLDTLARVYARPDRGLLDAPPEVALLASDYDVAREGVKLAEERRDLVAAQLCAMLGNVEGYRGAWGKASWSSRTRSRTDWKLVADELSASLEARFGDIGAAIVRDLIAKYTTTTSSRVLDVRFKKR
jgi:RNase P/RNase MRP subunit POP5